MNDFTGRVKRDEWHPPNGFRRTVTVAMDTAQYQMDINHMQATKGEDLYGTFNMVMRRKPKVCCLNAYVLTPFSKASSFPEQSSLTHVIHYVSQQA